MLEDVFEELSSRPRRDDEAEADEDVDGTEAVEGDDACRREILGRRRADCFVVGTSSWVSSSSDERSSSPTSGSSMSRSPS